MTWTMNHVTNIETTKIDTLPKNMSRFNLALFRLLSYYAREGENATLVITVHISTDRNNLST